MIAADDGGQIATRHPGLSSATWERLSQDSLWCSP